MKDVTKFLERGVEQVFPNKSALERALKGEKKLIFYHGIDPTGPSIHLGHMTQLRKLSQLQEIGHKVIILIGDFTAMIGDPTDKAEVRKKLSKDKIRENLKLYRDQIAKFIDLDNEDRGEYRFNSEWFSEIQTDDIIEIASYLTVDSLMKRDMFVRRKEEGKPIYLHEFLYPLMQGYDSVALDVNGEIGGNDQMFNMLVGRDLMSSLRNKNKFVLTTKLLTDAAGKKMGKTEGNMVSFTDSPDDIYGKVMSWPDDMMTVAYEILTDIDPSDQEIRNNPLQLKKKLAHNIVSQIYSELEAGKSESSFTQTFKDGGFPEDALIAEAKKGRLLSEVLLESGLIQSKGEFSRLVKQSAIHLVDDGTRIDDSHYKIESNLRIRIGQNRFLEVKVK